MYPIVFVHSTGRSGTKFLADFISRASDGHVDSWHERLTTSAAARQFFRRYDDASLDEYLSQTPVRAMLDSIRDTARQRPYLEAGFTWHSLYPLLIREFGDSVQFVYQTRHPFDSAASQVIKGAYQGTPELQEWAQNIWLHPSDHVFHPDVPWDRMSPFEKALWRWGELDLYWRELQMRFPDSHWHVFKAEEMFRDVESTSLYWSLLGFEPPTRDVISQAAKAAFQNESDPKWQYWFGVGTEWRRYFEYPWILNLAAEYGYSSERNVIDLKRHKYAKPSDVFGRVSRRLRRIFDGTLRTQAS